MSNFSKLEKLLNTTEGMTALRYGSGNDDGTDTVTGVDWFTFNGVVASNIYVSGNSYVGFGSNSSHLKICNRDGKMYSLYRQEGVVGNQKFLKICWIGYTLYNGSGAAYSLTWELFLFDDGGLFVNLVTVPTSSSYLGTSSLTCGSNVCEFVVKAGTPNVYSFFCDDSGKFFVTNEIYPVAMNHVPSGSAEFTTTCIRNAESITGSKITWDSNVPEGTTLKVYSKLSNGNYSQCNCGGPVTCITPGADVSNETLYIKVEMTTEDPALTPTLSNLFVQILSAGDDHILVLEFEKGNVNSFQNAVGDINVVYAGGTLLGLGGAVAPFDMNFTPEGLNAKNNPSDCEHIEISSIEAICDLKRIMYTSVQSGNEHIEITGVEAFGTLTSINDI